MQYGDMSYRVQCLDNTVFFLLLCFCVGILLQNQSTVPKNEWHTHYYKFFFAIVFFEGGYKAALSCWSAEAIMQTYIFFWPQKNATTWLDTPI